MQFGKSLVQLVHQLLESLHLPHLDDGLPRMAVCRKSGEIGAQVEQFVLKSCHEVIEALPVGERDLSIPIRDAHEPEEGVQLVDGSEALDPERVFRHPLPSHQTRLSLVAASGIDAIDPDRHANWTI